MYKSLLIISITLMSAISYSATPVEIKMIFSTYEKEREAFFKINFTKEIAAREVTKFSNSTKDKYEKIVAIEKTIPEDEQLTIEGSTIMSEANRLEYLVDLTKTSMDTSQCKIVEFDLQNDNGEEEVDQFRVNLLKTITQICKK